jgi:outer membrane protein
MARPTRFRGTPFAPAALAVLLFPASVSAAGLPLIDFRAEVGHWGATPTGTVASGDDDFDVEDDLGFDRNGANMFMAEFEHPVPVLPNVRLRHSRLDDTSRSTITTTRQFGPVQFQTNERVRSSYDLEMTDATFYYSPVNNWVAIDLGITARRINVDVLLESRDTGDRERAGGSLWLPMGHLGGRVDLPFTGVYAAAEVNAISTGDERMRDARASLGWEMTSNFGVALGYRELRVEIDDVDDLRADVDFGGPFATATLRF